MKWMFENGKRRLTLLFAVATVVAVAENSFAEDRIFPNAGGDLADGTAWGGMVPNAADLVKINLPGDYMLSDNVTFKALNVTVGGCTFSLGNYGMTLANASEYGIRVEAAANARTVFSGGVYNLSGTAECEAARAGLGLNTVFTDNCIITNASKFYAGRYGSGAKTEIADGAKIYAATAYISYETSSREHALEIYGGGRLHASADFYSDNGTDGAHGGNSLFVHGIGSSVSFTGSNQVRLGFKQHSNSYRFSDGASFTSENGGMALGWFPNAASNTLSVTGGAIARLGKVHYRTRGNRITVSNATFTCTSEFAMSYSAHASNNLFRAYGPDTSLTLPAGDIFCSRTMTNRCNTFSLEGGVKWDCGRRNSMLARSHHSAFRLAGAGTVLYGTNDWFYIGDKDYAPTMSSISNCFAVLDGAVFNATWVPVMGVANKVCVSNATVNIANNGTRGLHVGYGMNSPSTTNCLLVLQGTEPRVAISTTSNNDSCKFDNGATLRFEIPEEGYARNFIPLTMTGPLVFSEKGTRLEIDCGKFVEHTGGKLNLIRAKKIDSTTQGILRACASTLPETCTLTVTDTDVYIKSPRKTGLIISIF